MAINVIQDKLLTLSQAARHAKPGDRRLAPSTIWRWYRKGIAGVKLETICLGGTRYTSSASLQLFFDAITRAKSAQANVGNTTTGTPDRSAETQRKLDEAQLT